MKCPFCSTEIAPGALACPSCRAFQTVERTPLGVFTGWLGIIASVLTAMLLIPVPLMALAGISLQGFPWVLPIIGSSVAVGAFWHSRSTKHIVWLPHKEIR